MHYGKKCKIDLLMGSLIHAIYINGALLLISV